MEKMGIEGKLGHKSREVWNMTKILGALWTINTLDSSFKFWDI
jgi:hypothetical protein